MNITVESGSRGEAADGEMAEKIGQQVEGSIRVLIGQELRTAMRPGGIFSS